MVSNASTVDEFLATVSESERDVFVALRRMFKKGGRRIVESMEYRMPTYKIGQQMVGAFNKQKHYLCLYANPKAIDPHRKELGRLSCGKSCIRFRKPGDLPLDLAAKIIKAAAKLASG